MSEIHVTVCKWAEGRPLMLRWTDPISGKRKTKSTGTTSQRKAERLAGELEGKLRAGSTMLPSRITWREFREKYDDEKLAGLARDTREAYNVALDHVSRVLAPDRLCRLSSQAMSGFVASLRKGGMGETTIDRHLRHIGAALRWAERQGYLTKAPTIDRPKLPGKMKGRPITGEEFDRMVEAAPKVRKQDPAPWQRLLRGLWLSGLRISEAVKLSWDAGPFQVDLTGRYPAFRIQGAGQKSRKAEYAPMVPEFAEFLAETPKEDRQGFVFPLASGEDGRQIDRKAAGRAVARMGEKAGIVVDAETGTTASAHDLRRSFGSRWAKKVMPAVLQRLMRHRQISTTMVHYVDLGADDVAADLWASHAKRPEIRADGNNHGNIAETVGKSHAQDIDATSREVSSYERVAEGI